MEQWTSGPAGRLAALYASLCLRVWSEFRGIPPREPPNCFWSKRKKEKDPPKMQASHVARHDATPPHSRSCMAVSLPFLPVPVPVLCGRLLHRAPLVLPARPRADNTTLLLSRRPHTLCLVGAEPPSQQGKPGESGRMRRKNPTKAVKIRRHTQRPHTPVAMKTGPDPLKNSPDPLKIQPQIR